LSFPVAVPAINSTPHYVHAKEAQAKSRGEEEWDMGGRENKGMVFWLAI
jgi:hypothetical protein